ncbi:MAG: chromosome segregation SMC family protein, partial [Pseudomonadota bacterium]
MRITSLKLHGFKSFVDPTELIIEPGLTGVVGPNGCGKSNLLEALRWAMGESSHKSMRAAAMDDVIFSGTTSRPPRNMAEVAMVLDNAERLAPDAFNDSETIEISRRIEREAGSNYRVNGRDVRARDIRLLFEDASTGARSPALVRQGQIGDIVNAKPEARRRILEDAAGTAGLYTRRHEAELKLNAAEANLARIDDVIGGLTSQIETLKRQARQARRYHSLSSDIRQAEALFLFICWQEAETGNLQASAVLTSAIQNHSETTRYEAVAIKNEAAAAEAIEPLQIAEAAKSAELTRHAVSLEHFDAETAFIQKQAQDLKLRQAQVRSDLARENEIKSEAEDNLQKVVSELTELHAEQSGADEHLATSKTACEQAQQTSTEREGTLATAVNDLSHHDAHISTLKKQLSEFVSSADALRLEITQATEKLATLAATKSASADLQALRERTQATEDRVARLTREIQDGEEALQSLDEAVSKAQTHANNVSQKRVAIATEITTLSNLLKARRGSDRKAGNKADKPNEAEHLLDLMQVKPGFERALAAAFGADLEATLDTSDPLHWRHLAAVEAQTVGLEHHLPQVKTTLADKVQGPDAVMHRLQQTGIVKREDGTRLQDHLLPGQQLVSKEGDLWRWDGLVASRDQETPAARLLAQRNRLEALHDEQRDIDEAHSSVQEQLAHAVSQQRQAQATRQERSQQLATLNSSVSQDRRAL